MVREDGGLSVCRYSALVTWGKKTRVARPKGAFNGSQLAKFSKRSIDKTRTVMSYQMRIRREAEARAPV